MVINSVGTRLFRTLSSGRKVVTETAGNKTVTKVLDIFDNVLIDRVKTIERAVVGNKKVITKNETRLVNTYSPIDYRPNESFGFKYKSERVYDKSGKLLGLRETENAPGRVWTMSGQNPLEHMPDVVHVTKSVPDGRHVFSYAKQKDIYSPAAKSYIKDFKDGKVTYKIKTSPVGDNKQAYNGLPLGSRKPQYNFSPSEVQGAFDKARTGDDFYYSNYFGRGGGGVVRYNKRGLPLPQPFHNVEVMNYNELENMSLKDMRNAWLRANSRPNQYNAVYSNYKMNMDFLNKPYNKAFNLNA